MVTQSIYIFKNIVFTKTWSELLYTIFPSEK